MIHNTFGPARLTAGLMLAIQAWMIPPPVLADAPLNPATQPHPVPMTAPERANLLRVLDWWREVIEAGHLERVPHYQAESYIQHNPNINTGRAGFLEAFSRDNTPINPIPPRLKNPPPVAGARGEFVWILWERPRPAAAGQPAYYQNRFELLRVRDGLVQEHWDADRKEAGSGAVIYGKSPRAPAELDTGAPTAAEREVRKIAVAAATEVFLQHHVELASKLIAADYIEHDPNLVSQSTLVGRLNDYRAPGALQSPDPAVSIVNGEYVLMMWNLTAPDPDDRGKSYPWNYFQLMRVHGGLVVEHWDQDALRGSNAPAD